MRLALICHASLGGSSRVGTRLAQALARRGHDVSLVASSLPPTAPHELDAIHLELLGPGNGHSWTSVLEPRWDYDRLGVLGARLEAIVKRRGVQVVHYHYAWPFAHVVRDLKARLGPRAPLFVGTLHGTDITHPPDGSSSTVLLNTDVLTTVSRCYAGLARARLGLPVEPIVIPNFVDPQEFPRSTDFIDARGGPRKPRIVHVSNFRPVKDPEGVARIFIALRRRLPAELWLVGLGAGCGVIETSLREAGLSEDVHVLGYQADVGRILAQCDLLLVPSREESFCLAALEAMASGLCVLASAVGGLRELVEEGRTGVLFEPGDHEGAARLAIQVLTDHEKRLVMRRRARERARLFSHGLAVTRYERLYASAAPVSQTCAPRLAYETL